MKHTPGKWRILNDAEYYEVMGAEPEYENLLHIYSEPFFIADVMGGLDAGQQVANAQLIAKAPEVRAAADELARASAKILEWYDGVHTRREVLHEGAGMMKRALEKWEKASKK